MSREAIPLVPRDPKGRAQIVAIGRLSKKKKTAGETRETMESSLAVANAFIKNIYKGRKEVTQLAEQASGLIANRRTIQQAKELIASGTIDLVITEDLSRLYRNPRLQHEFVDFCYDAGVRFISVADDIDTADEEWESRMGVATFRHTMPIVDTRRRYKRRNLHAFHNGGNVQKPEVVVSKDRGGHQL